MRRPCGTFDEDYGQDMAICRTRFQWLVAIIAGVLFLFVFPRFAGTAWISMANIIAITAIAALGLNILTGYCGQLNFGHAAFVASGAYITAMLINHLGWSWWATLPFAVVGTALLGLLFGLPSLRIKGFYIAVSTLAGFFIIMFALAHGGDATGGIYGLKVGTVELGNIVIDTEEKFFFLIMGFTMLMTFLAKNIVRGRLGRAFIAVRDNDVAAELMGIDIFRYKLIAFAICSGYAAVAGSLQAAYYGYISPEQFAFVDCIWYLGYIIVGGMGTIVGTFLGVAFLRLLGYGITVGAPAIMATTTIFGGSQVLASLMMIVFGLVIILFLIFEPRGLYHRWELMKSSFRLWPFTY